MASVLNIISSFACTLTKRVHFKEAVADFFMYDVLLVLKICSVLRTQELIQVRFSENPELLKMFCMLLSLTLIRCRNFYLRILFIFIF